MSQNAKRFWNIWDKFGVFLILLSVVVVFAILDPKIIHPNQMSTLLARTATTGIASVGMMFAITGGGFDLSIGSIISLSSCVMGINMVNGMNPYLAILLGFIVAVLCGVVNGLIITKLKIQTFVATLATQLAFSGIALVYSNGKNTLIKSGVNKELKTLITGKVFGIVSWQIVLLFMAFLIGYVIYTYTPFGVKVRAVGSNEGAARTTGINVDRTFIMIFVMTALTAGGAALLTTARLSTANPTIGAGFELDVITAVILGGTSLSGGKGNVWGTLVGAILLTFVKMGLNILGVGEAYQKLAIAIVLVFSLLINGIKLIMQKEGN